jgi:UMF1 family MFS transporter
MQATLMEKNNPKVINAWCLYDWANSAYNLTITTAIFPIYFSSVAPQSIRFLGVTKDNSVMYTYSLSLSFVIVCLLSPFLSGIADYSDRKKSFMQAFVWLGSIACGLLFFFTGENTSFGITCFMLASIGYAGSLVFYNAYLPAIATPDRFDRISARGYAMGYIGSVLLLIVNLVTITFYDRLGLENKGVASRLSFLSVGLWWIGFSIYTFVHLPGRTHRTREAAGEGFNYLFKGFGELRKVFGEVRESPHLTRFLLGFFFYSMGFQTIMYLASIFGAVELKLPEASLIGTVLIIQLIAVLGAYLFTRIAGRAGNLKTLTGAVALCIVICFGAYFTTTPTQFYVLAVVVGLVMGGLQSMSRATYSKLLPDTTDHASYFSFYEFTEKTGIVLGTATYAFMEDVTGSMRNSLFALIAFFAIGLFFLTRMLGNRKAVAAGV